MKWWPPIVPLAVMAGFGGWFAYRGTEAIRTQSYEFPYSVGPRGRTDHVRSIRFEGAEALRVGAGMRAGGSCGVLWFVAPSRGR